jgi:alpha amylase-like protein
MRLNPHLYEISAWPWLERLSAESGRRVTLLNVPETTWDGIATQGFDCVFLMGVWRRSAIGRLMSRTDRGLIDAYDHALPGWSMQDVVGSPYCIVAYEPDDRMGGWAGVDAARAALNRRGMQLILDFVPNHTGFDFEWIRARPECYVHGSLDNYRAAPELFHPIEDADGRSVSFIACGRDPYFPPWRDVAQLNYFNPETRAAMIGVLESLAQHCDGVRCDMAMLVLNDVFEQTWSGRVDLRWPKPAEEFWPEAIRRVPSLTYLAEVYWDREWQLLQQGFHFTYAKHLLDLLHRADAPAVRAHVRNEVRPHSQEVDTGLGSDPITQPLARFLENHDEPRSAATFEGRIPAAAVAAYGLPGMRFFFDGQLSGAHVHSPVQLGRWPSEAVDEPIRDFYVRLLPTLKQPLFHDGAWSLLDVRSAGDETFDALVAYAWSSGAVLVSNLGSREAQGLVTLASIPDADATDFCDQLTGNTYRWNRDDLRNGLYVRLGAGAAHVFLLRPT